MIGCVKHTGKCASGKACGTCLANGLPFARVRDAVERPPRNQGNDAFPCYQGKHIHRIARLAKLTDNLEATIKVSSTALKKIGCRRKKKSRTSSPTISGPNPLFCALRGYFDSSKKHFLGAS